MLHATSATSVLTDAFLLRHVASFQCGLPRNIVELARARRGHYAMFKARPSPGVNPLIAGGLLPTIAIKENNLPLMQRLVRYQREQPAYETDPRYTSFRFVWRDCLAFGELAMIEYAHHNVDPSLLDAPKDKDLDGDLTCVFKRRNDAIIEWLLTHRPEYKTHLTSDHLVAMITSTETGRSGTRRLFQWLEANVPTDFPYTPRVMDAAAAAGDLDLVQYLHATRVLEDVSGCTPDAMNNAAQNGHLDIVRFLHENRTEGCTRKAMNGAAEKGHLEVVRFLHEHRTEGCSKQAMTRAPNLAMVRFLHENRTEGCMPRAMDTAAARGDLDTVRFLHENRTEGCTFRALDGAATNGHLEIVQFLHSNRTEGCTSDATDGAAKNGHLQVVRFLRQHCKQEEQDEQEDEEVEPLAMGLAASNGHFEIVQFLHDEKIKNHYEIAIENAARAGRLDILQYLLQVAPTSLTNDTMSNAMEYAARYRHLHVLVFFHENHPDLAASECLRAIWMAADYGYLEVVKYLLTASPRSGHSVMINDAAKEGHLEVVQYLHENFHEHCTAAAMRNAASGGHTRVVKYLSEHCDASDGSALPQACGYGYLSLVQYLVETRTDGCLVEAKAKAVEQGKPVVADYLTRMMEPSAEAKPQ